MGAFAEAAEAVRQIEVWQLTADRADVELVERCVDGGQATRVLQAVCERPAASFSLGAPLRARGGISGADYRLVLRLVTRKRRALGLPVGDEEPAPEPVTKVESVSTPANDTELPPLRCPVCGEVAGRANRRTPPAFVPLCLPHRADAFDYRSRRGGKPTPEETVRALKGETAPTAPEVASSGAPGDAVAHEPEAASVSAARDVPVATEPDTTATPSEGGRCAAKGCGRAVGPIRSTTPEASRAFCPGHRQTARGLRKGHPDWSEAQAADYLRAHERDAYPDRATNAEPAHDPAPEVPEVPASPGAPGDDPRTKREGCRWPEGCRGLAFASGYCGPHTRKARELGLLPPKNAALPASVQVQAIVARTSDERVCGAREEAPVTSPVVTAPSPAAPVAIVVTPRSEGEALASLFGELRTLITRLGGWDTARALAARVERAGGADALLALLDTLEAR